VTMPSPVPDSFLGKMLNEFGLQWTHLAIFSGLVFSTFGLDKYFNTGAWMLTTIGSFAVVFLFRRDVSARFALVTLISAILMGGVIAAGLFLAQCYPGGGGIPQFLQHHRIASTVFLGAATGVPLATVILSYRLREDLYGGTFPQEIRKAIQVNLADLAFFKRNQRYEFTVMEVTSMHVKVQSILSYTIVNRTASEKVFTMSLTPMRERVEYVSLISTTPVIEPRAACK
jgi:hypothetical protein